MRLEWSKGRTLLVDLARPEEAEEILDFLNVHFLPVSPNNHLISYDQPETQSTEDQEGGTTFFLQVIQECLRTPHSLVVRDQSTDQLVAVRINKIEDSSAHSGRNHKQPERLLFALLDALKKNADLHEKYETNRILHLCMIAVSEQHCGEGLATKLNELSMDLAIQGGAGAIKTEAVSEYAAKSVAKLGFTVISSIDYATFEFNGTKPFADNADLLAEHPTARLMARRLP